MAAEEFSTQDIRFGLEGLNLHLKPDLVPPTQLTRMTNLSRIQQGGIAVRPGLNFFRSGGAYTSDYHSMIRLNGGIPEVSATFARFIGVGTSLYQGKDLLAFLSGGWSGRPISFLTARPRMSARDWVMAADFSKMVQIDKTGPETAEEFPLGLPKPSSPSSVSVGAGGSTLIDNFGTAGWTNNKGSTLSGIPTNAVAPGIFGNAVAFTSNKGTATGSYYNYWNKANAKNLNLVGGAAASDNDHIQFSFMLDRPDIVSEIRIYFVLGAFSTTALPAAVTGLNGNAYVKTFAPQPFTSAATFDESTLNSGARALARQKQSKALKGKRVPRPGERVITELPGNETRRAGQELPRLDQKETAAGVNQWSKFGVVGVPLRRGDFKRIGTDENLDWSDVSGMVVAINITQPINVNLSVDDMALVGGAGPDNSEPGLAKYDYRTTNYNTRTGDESNPSDEMDSDDFVDSIRQAITINPPAYGNSDVRQRFYRRGGTLVEDWYFVDQNSADGAVYTDRFSDVEIQAAGLLEIDNDQPVTTVDVLGETVYGQPLPSLWMVGDIMCGCGDPNRSGFVYHSKPGKYGSWPAANSLEVCSGSERLISGFSYGGQGFVFSRKRLYALYPNLSASGRIASTGTACSRGLVNRHALTIGREGVYFVSWDGVFLTQGGAEINLTDGWVGALFNDTNQGIDYDPISWADYDQHRLEIYGDELYYFHTDISGNRRALVYSIQHKFWRMYQFPSGSGLFGYAELEEDNVYAFFIGGRGGIFTLDGGSFSDQTVNSSGGVVTNAISYVARCGYLDQGATRRKKLYGDFVLEADRKDITFDLKFLFNNGSIQSAASVTEGSGLFPGFSATQSTSADPFGGPQAPVQSRIRYTFDLLDAGGGPGPQYAYNCAVEISGSTSTQRPTFFWGGLSYTIQPDTIINRVTNWDHVGRLTHKWFKGVIIEWEPDSNNFDPGLQANADIYGDGVLQTSIRLVPSDDDEVTGGFSQRKVVQRSFEQFLAHHVRIVPRGTVGVNGFPVSIRIHSVQWIADEEPAYLTRWETQEQNHGICGWHYPLYAQITMRLGVTGNVESGFIVTPVSLDLTSYSQSEGRLLPPSSIVKTYTIPGLTDPVFSGGSAPKKRTYFVPFEAVRGIAHKYLFTSSGPFWLYREESCVWVQPWGAEGPIRVQPFGNDDLDLVRAMYSTEGVATREGGGR